MLLTEVQQKVQLVEGQFTPAEALDVITALIDEKINFHKIQRLSTCEGDECADTSYCNERIQELMAEKERARSFIMSAKAEGFNVRINGNLDITFD